MKEYPEEFKLVRDLFGDQPYGVGLKKGDDNFRKFLNNRLREIMKNEDWQIAYARTIQKMLELPDGSDLTATNATPQTRDGGCCRPPADP
jgi:ABC-type amino acid transport substrate-binding protein